LGHASQYTEVKIEASNCVSAGLGELGMQGAEQSSREAMPIVGAPEAAAGPITVAAAVAGSIRRAWPAP
jgi:hypothetical protein